MTRPKLTLRWLTLGVAAICTSVLLNAALTYHNLRRLDDERQSVAQAAELKRTLAAVLGAVVEAEMAVRSYVLSGGGAGYLDDYRRALDRNDGLMSSLRTRVHGPQQAERYGRLKRAMDQRLELLHRVLTVYQNEGTEAVLNIVATGRGVVLMGELRDAMADMEGRSKATLSDAAARAARDLFTTLSGLVTLTLVSAMLLVVVAVRTRREIRLRERSAETAFDTAQMLRLVIDTIPQRIFWKGPDGRYLGCNTAFARDAGRETPAEVVGKTDAQLYGDEAAARFSATDARIFNDGVSLADYEAAVALRGRETWLKKTKVPLHDAKGRVIGILGAYEDITARKTAERLLAIRGKALDSSVNGIFITGAPGKGSLIEYANPVIEQITGYAPSELLGRNCRILQGKETEQPGVADIRLALKEGRSCNVVLHNYRKDGRKFWNDLTIAPVRDEDDVITHHIGIVNDVTERVCHEEALQREANFDALTGLSNRNLLGDRLGEMLAHARRAHERLAVVMLDLDNFKFVNDSLGHHAGDALLVQTAARLRDTLREHDTVARYAGDEFVLVVSDCADGESVASLMSRVLTALAEPLTIAETRLCVTCSMGISIYPDDGTDAATLLRHADLALYRAKENGRNNFEFFEPEMSRRVHERLWLARDLRTGLEQGQFFLHFQPQVDLRSGAIVGAEALARWRHPAQGTIMPARFIPVAEDSALIMPIGEWILQAACTQCKAWHDAGLAHIRISVNLSAVQIRQRGFAQTVANTLHRSGLAPHYLELEVTESLLMLQTDDVVRTLADIRRMGVRLAIDDFGTGYSSLNYLKRLPVDRLKIDGSFLKDVPRDVSNRSITLAVIALARNMGLGMIAEGVENEEQLAFLRDHDCDEIQGYHFSKPLDSEALAEVLSAHRTVSAA
ncbi:MAG: EAL domain-containing protein [Rhodospirillaceae bacterium]